MQTLHVIDCESETSGQQQQQQQQQVYAVKALSSDTIAQLKDKILNIIYRYVPFSLRPDSTELDLGNYYYYYYFNFYKRLLLGTRPNTK